MFVHREFLSVFHFGNMLTCLSLSVIAVTQQMNKERSKTGSRHDSSKAIEQLCVKLVKASVK